MARLRATKMLCATLLVCTGAICMSIGALLPYGALGLLIGAILLAVGIPMLVRQWTNRGVMSYLADAWRWFWGREPRPESPAEPTAETAGRA